MIKKSQFKSIWVLIFYVVGDQGEMDMLENSSNVETQAKLRVEFLKALTLLESKVLKGFIVWYAFVLTESAINLLLYFVKYSPAKLSLSTKAAHRQLTLARTA